jgi:urea transport system permease protein
MTALLTALVLAAAVDASTLEKIARGSQAERAAAVSALAAAGDAAAAPLLTAMLEGRLHAGPEGPILIEVGGKLRDALTGAPAARPDDLERVVINNRMRRSLERALSALALFAPQPAERLAAARALQQEPDPDLLPSVEAALQQEKEKDVREALLTTQAMLALSAPEPARRRAAVEQLRRITIHI